MKFFTKFPQFKSKLNSHIKKDIFNELKKFINNEAILKIALIQEINPKIKNNEIYKDKELLDNFMILDKLNKHDIQILKKVDEYKELIILFIITTGYLLLNRNIKYAKNIINREHIIYAFKLLQHLEVQKIREKWEDKFFSYLYPIEFSKYTSLLRQAKRKYFSVRKEIIDSFITLFETHKIDAKIEMRLKTISSVHNKIETQQILYSQIMDQIGLRIIVNSIEDCYKIMDLIILIYNVKLDMIKDYIAVPKENGYSSLHITLIYENYPVELQIRTKKMDDWAKYGKASHI